MTNVIRAPLYTVIDRSSWYRDWGYSLSPSLLAPVSTTGSSVLRNVLYTPRPTLDWYRDYSQNLVILQPTTATATAVTVLRNILYAPKPQIVWYQDWSQNLLQTTLGKVPPLPSNQFDWPLPKVPPPIDQFEGFFNVNLYPPFVPPQFTNIYYRPLQPTVGHLGFLGMY